MDTIRVAISESAVPIRLTYKQWVHIIESHDYMAGNLDLVLESENPDYIVCGWTDELIALGRGATVGLLMFIAGFFYTLYLLLNWIKSGYKISSVVGHGGMVIGSRWWLEVRDEDRCL